MLNDPAKQLKIVIVEARQIRQLLSRKLPHGLAFTLSLRNSPGSAMKTP
jgi:hypothetical protein